MAAYLVVIEHVHDPSRGVYRMTVGLAEDVDQPMVDEQGQALLDDEDRPLTETATTVVPLTDFVWANDDERWEGRDEEWIAKAQRTQVKRHLAKVEKEQADLEAQAARVKPLTDGGEKLKEIGS